MFMTYYVTYSMWTCSIFFLFFYLSVSFKAPLTSGMCFSISSMSPWLSARAAATSDLSSSWRLGCLASSYKVHSRVMEVWKTRLKKKKKKLSGLLETNYFSSLFLTVSTPPAISSVMLALMSSMDSLSSRSRLAKTPGYSFEGPVSWRKRL